LEAVLEPLKRRFLTQGGPPKWRFATGSGDQGSFTEPQSKHFGFPLFSGIVARRIHPYTKAKPTSRRIVATRLLVGKNNRRNQNKRPNRPQATTPQSSQLLGNDPPANVPPINDPPAVINNAPAANDPPANVPPINDPPAVINNAPAANDPPGKPPWPERLYDWACEYAVTSGITATAVLLAICYGIYWIIQYHADIKAKLDNIDRAFQLIDSKIETKTSTTIEAKLSEVHKQLQTLKGQLEVDHRVNEYLNQMSGLTCGTDYDAMLMVYDRLIADEKYPQMSASALSPIYSKVLWICSKANRLPKLSVEELDKMAQGMEIHSCHGDNRYFLGVGYLGRKQTKKGRDNLSKAYAAPLPIERPNSPVPVVKLPGSQVVFADSGIVAMLLVCELLEDRPNTSTVPEKTRAALAALDLLVSEHRAIEIPIVLRRLDVLRESEFIKHILGDNAGLLVQAYDDLRAELRKNEIMARVADTAKIGAPPKYVPVRSLTDKGVRSSADYSTDCQEHKADPAP
jgi:hypothetical protein